MKILSISLIIFLILLATITANIIYVNKTVDTLTELTENVISSDKRQEPFEKLEEYWEKNRAKFEFSTSHILIDAVSTRIESLKVYIENEETLMILHEAAILKKEIAELKRLERFSFENIF